MLQRVGSGDKGFTKTSGVFEIGNSCLRGKGEGEKGSGINRD